MLDWLVHNAYRLNLNGESMGETNLGLTAAASSEQQGNVVRRYVTSAWIE